MVIDTSALIAFLEDEPEASRIATALTSGAALRVSTATVLEAGIVVEARRGEHGGRELDLLLHRLGVEQVPVTAEQVELARSAWRQYGKGRHRAALNYGDCFAYALAASLGEPLLFVGNDFSRTEITPA
jgi:ribonuclease VapC